MATKNLFAMSFITESLQKKASAIISELPAQFSTRLFIWKLADEHEHDYIEMLIAATKTEKTRSFHNLHAQIGGYFQKSEVESHHIAIKCLHQIRCNMRLSTAYSILKELDSDALQKYIYENITSHRITNNCGGIAA